MIQLNTTAQEILATRNRSYYLHISDAEMKFVSSTPLLKDSEKLIWLNIAQLTSTDSRLSCRLTYKQISERVGKSAHSMYRPIKTLKNKGFLQAMYDEDSRLTTYYLDLPQKGRVALAMAPSRGAKRGEEYGYSTPISLETYPQCDILTNTPPANLQGAPLQACNQPLCEPAASPLVSLQPLLLNINNKNKKHKSHDASDDSNPEQLTACKVPEPMPDDANALVLKYYEKLDEIRETKPDISLLQANRLAHQAFTASENSIIHHALIAEAKQQELVEHKEKAASESREAELRASKLVPAAVASNPKPSGAKQPSQVESLIFEGEHYFIEREVKLKLFSEIPKLYAENKIKLSGPQRSLEKLLTEVLYYITKAGSMHDEVKSQLNKYNIAKKLCQVARWATPQGIANIEIVNREKSWAAKKEQECQRGRLAPFLMGFINKKIINNFQDNGA